MTIRSHTKSIFKLIAVTLTVMFYALSGSTDKRNMSVENYRQTYNKVLENDMAMTEAKTIILFVIGIVIFASLIPTAITTIHDANTTGWGESEQSLWGIFGLIVIGVAVYKLIE